ncbi:response regulator [Cesiribacter andamanensis]|uniref:Putative transcriptional regulatory protein NarL n=1 Tax=Cesiribacter andamanensis AMV16 TaxID=1279009 RepID=M7NLZ4_9BACT|nr:response regulator transcription factor [Cesiribacter andamanensis]EMR02775.1 putative transcriptional regulatory protein NarL [Cesiribacter andamanensis AMV16]
MATKLLVYEDNELLRESLSGLISLNSRLQLLGAFSDVLSVKEEVLRYRPDLVIMDIEMPQMSGIEAVRKIRSFQAALPVLMLTVFDDNVHVFEAIRAGASGYLLKKHIASRLFDALDELMAGGAPMSPSIARMVISSMHKQGHGADYGLTSREKEILTELSRGNSYKLIAAQLGISLDTVRTHIKNIYEKLHVHSQTEAVSKAIQEKLV